MKLILIFASLGLSFVGCVSQQQSTALGTVQQYLQGLLQHNLTTKPSPITALEPEVTPSPALIDFAISNGLSPRDLESLSADAMEALQAAFNTNNLTLSPAAITTAPETVKVTPSPGLIALAKSNGLSLNDLVSLSSDAMNALQAAFDTNVFMLLPAKTSAPETVKVTPSPALIALAKSNGLSQNDLASLSSDAMQALQAAFDSAHF